MQPAVSVGGVWVWLLPLFFFGPGIHTEFRLLLGCRCRASAPFWSTGTPHLPNNSAHSPSTLRKPRISKLSHQFAGSIIRREFRRQKNQDDGSVTRSTETPALGYGIRALRHFRSGSVASIGGVVRGARPYCCYPVPGHKQSLIHLTNTTNTHTIDRFQKTGSGKQKKTGTRSHRSAGKSWGYWGRFGESLECGGTSALSGLRTPIIGPKRLSPLFLAFVFQLRVRSSHPQSEASFLGLGDEAS